MDVEPYHLYFIQSASQRYKISLDVSSPLSALTAKITESSGIPGHEQRVYHNGSLLILIPTEIVSSLCIPPGSELVLRHSHSGAVGGGGGVGGGTALSTGAPRRMRLPLHMGVGPMPLDPQTYPFLEELPQEATPEQIFAIAAVNPTIAQQLGQDEELALTLKAPTSEPLKLLMQRRMLERSLAEVERARKAREMEGRLLTNPNDVEAQRFLEEEIQRRNVDENHHLAHQIMPESFTRSIMLIVKLSVNGFPCQAMVDTGAQITIVSKRTAEQCQIMRLVDTRFKGIAKGVGTGVILGRVHACSLKLGENHFTASFTVMERDDMDFLLGLDFMRRFSAVVDLSKSELRLQLADGACARVPFLTERELSGSLDKLESGAEPSSNPSSGGGGSGSGSGSGSGGGSGGAGGASSSAPGANPQGGGAPPLFDLSSLFPPK